MKSTLIPLLAAAMGASADATPDTVWFDLDATRPCDSLLTIQGAAASAVLGDFVTDSVTHLKFAGRGGFQIPSWTPPSGAWYVVARLRMDAYGDKDSWFISDILNSATWPDSYTNPMIQGFQFRTGGSGLFPVSPRNPALSDEEWQSTLDAFDHAYQAQMSQCLAGFSMASTDSVVNWIQSNSDRCLPLGRWVHLVASWDGKRQHLYLDGVEVTDTLRQLGQGLAPRMDKGMPLAIGMRGAAASGQLQLFQGGMQSVRILKGSLDSAKALALYQADMKPVVGSCQAVPVIVRPEVAQIVVAKDVVTIRLVASSSCKPGLLPDLVLHPGDSLDVLAVSVDGKRTRIASARVGSLSFPIEALGMESRDVVPFVLKVRIVRAPVAGRVGAATETAWEMERPMTYAAGGLTRAARGASVEAVRLLPGARLQAPGVRQLVARNADGRRIVLSRAPSDGIWDLSILPRGMWWIRAGGHVVALPRF